MRAPNGVLTVSDLAPMAPCPYDKRGRHHMAFVIPETSEGDLTLACEACAAIRRVPVSGPLYAGSADDLLNAEIAALFE